MRCGVALNLNLPLPATSQVLVFFPWDSLTPFCYRWEQVVDLTYSLRLGAKPKPMDQDEAAVEKLR